MSSKRSNHLRSVKSSKRQRNFQPTAMSTLIPSSLMDIVSTIPPFQSPDERKRKEDDDSITYSST